MLSKEDRKPTQTKIFTKVIRSSLLLKADTILLSSDLSYILLILTFYTYMYMFSHTLNLTIQK